MSQYFLKLYKPFDGDISDKVNRSNYATMTDITNISHVDTASFTLKSNLGSLKTEIDKLDVNKLLSVSLDLSNLSDVVKNDIF